MCWILFIFLFLTKVCAEIDQSNWVDPHDMSPIYDKEFYPYDIEIKPSKISTIEDSCDRNEGQSLSYLKRTINMILNSVHEDVFNENKYSGHLIFEIDIEKYVRLQEFASDKFDDLSEVDFILSEILRKPSHAYLKEYFLGILQKIFKYISSRAGIAAICILSYLVVIYKLMRGNFRAWAIIKFLLINLLIFDFVFVWIRLYQRAEIDKMANLKHYQNSPDYCNPKKMNSYQIILSVLSSVDHCKEYHHVTFTDIFWNVSPGDVLTEMITTAITHPLKAIGPAIGQFVRGIYDALPFGIGLILLPLTLVFVMTMTCIILSFTLDIPIKFNFFHLISFSFGDRPQNNGNILTGKTVEQLLDIVNDKKNLRSLPDTSENQTKSSALGQSIKKIEDKPQITEDVKKQSEDDVSNVEKEGYEANVENCQIDRDDVNCQGDISENIEVVTLGKRKRDGAGDM